MKKIKLKLTRDELSNLAHFIEFSLHREQFRETKTDASKLVMATLAELLVWLNKVWDMFQTEYKFSISIPHGLALLEYCQNERCKIASTSAITINKVIGIIHQKTN
ncbi:hypothetical protein BDD43_3427 [Mucilaginibacter gracilis]|uniref:Uncharacterized protein n=1 Tax=Mucilaginibacter gracilis TaxID=423350 RepID=A0A495J4F7_9SPHI|nr:hypothetical protein [Mucilaginibacter gracilis]RKR83224.1 hypothetical protein BDD43_3427 [Mucilaginibacter gracilis]